MKFGLVARGEARGLGNLTAEVWRNLRPDRTLLVEMGDLARGFPVVHDYGPDATVVPFRGGVLDETVCRDWLAGLDVVLMVETAYDWRFPGWAADAGCASVLYAMPEFTPPNADAVHPLVTRWWNPTTWRQRHMPPGTVVVPMPVAADRFPEPGTREPGPLRVLHVAGHRAAHDRNGTLSVLMALRRVRRPMQVTIACQDRQFPASPRVPDRVDIRVETGGRADYWDLYAGHDLLVMPRRYGGLCLPVQEAMAAGLGVVMPDVSPNRGWPVVPLAATPQGHIRCAAGDVQIVTTSAQETATLLDRIAVDPAPLIEAQAASARWAAENTWDALRPVWISALAGAVLTARRTARAR